MTGDKDLGMRSGAPAPSIQHLRMIVGACRYMRNDEIRNAIKIPSFKSHIQKLAKNFFNSPNSSENVNMQNLENYTARIKRKRPRSILLDSYNPP
ncbi:hypothetical protein TNCV_497051 [Trichonephila clavipes]|nr:hypothetical protein TNCV_497051 [Trichonephila clavipes]